MQLTSLFQKVAIIHACVKSDSYFQFNVETDLVGMGSLKVGMA